MYLSKDRPIRPKSVGVQVGFRPLTQRGLSAQARHYAKKKTKSLSPRRCRLMQTLRVLGCSGKKRLHRGLIKTVTAIAELTVDRDLTALFF